jgi:hypothetical protein
MIPLSIYFPTFIHMYIIIFIAIYYCTVTTRGHHNSIIISIIITSHRINAFHRYSVANVIAGHWSLVIVASLHPSTCSLMSSWSDHSMALPSNPSNDNTPLTWSIICITPTATSTYMHATTTTTATATHHITQPNVVMSHLKHLNDWFVPLICLLNVFDC